MTEMSQQEDQSPQPTTSLHWVSQPMKRSKRKTAIASGSILLAGALTAYLMESLGFGLIAVLIMFGSLAKFFLPTRYTLDGAGITVKTTTQTLTRKWSAFRSFYADTNGALLSPFIVPSRLENFRGLYITFEDNRDEVIAFLESHIKTPDISEPPELSELSDAHTDTGTDTMKDSKA